MRGGTHRTIVSGSQIASSVLVLFTCLPLGIRLIFRELNVYYGCIHACKHGFVLLYVYMYLDKIYMIDKLTCSSLHFHYLTINLFDFVNTNKKPKSLEKHFDFTCTQSLT